MGLTTRGMAAQQAWSSTTHPQCRPPRILIKCTSQSEDEQLAQAIALSLGQAAPPPPQQQQRTASLSPRVPPPTAPRPGAAVTEVPLADGTALVRRIIDSDNSCLFNSVGYAMHRSRALAPRLRRARPARPPARQPLGRRPLRQEGQAGRPGEPLPDAPPPVGR